MIQAKSPPKFSGLLAVIVQFDSRINREIETVRQSALLRDADFVVSDPHVTLYQADLVDVPAAQVSKVLQEAASSLKASPLDLTHIDVYREHFIFWEASKGSSWVAAHYVCLQLARYRNRTSRPVLEGEVSGMGEAEGESFQRWGYPLAGEL